MDDKFDGEHVIGQINFEAPTCAKCGRTQTLAPGIDYFCENKACRDDLSHLQWFPPPLPHEWRGMFDGWKKDAQEYHAALKAIRHILQNEEDSHECCDKIEDVIKGVFET